MEDKEEEKKFCGFISGFIATTSVDSHGDQLTLQCLEKMKEEIDTNPKKKKMTLNHEKGNYIGEIVKTKITQENDIFKLFAEIGIYKEREEVLIMIKKGELTGFSWEGFTNQKNFEDSKIKIEVDGKFHHEIEKILEENNIEYEINMKKSADSLTVIGLLLGGISNLLAIIGIIITLKKRKPSLVVNIILNNEKIEINEKNRNKIESILNTLN